MKEARCRIVKNIEIDNETECWNYKGAVRENGYCRTTFKMKPWYIHRLSYLAFKGDIPEGIDVCHSCDNRRCCNPEHLFLGTRKENMEDALKKGRIAKGSMLPQAKLTEQDIIDIIKRSKGAELYKDIANCYNVCVQTIGKIAIYKGGVRRGKQMDRNR